jgi:hypothetical protein
MDVNGQKIEAQIICISETVYSIVVVATFYKFKFGIISVVIYYLKKKKIKQADI